MATRTFKIKIEGRTFEAEVEEIGGGPQTVVASPRPVATVAASPPTVAAAGGNAISAPMPGKIISINVSRGQQVKTGDVVVILEAMKMEQEIKSSLSGTVKDILVAAGESVKKEQALIVIG
jgi:glutaconyl-CoA/methylmalonyl-CoA decarboxylase subunit gamma